MPVDLRVIWDVGKQFIGWFLLAAFLTNLVYLRATTRVRFSIASLAGIAMTALLIGTLPLSIFVVGGVATTIPNLTSSNAVTPAGLILIPLIFALISAVAASALLRAFKLRITRRGFWPLVLLNISGLALAFAWILVHIRPAEA